MSNTEDRVRALMTTDETLDDVKRARLWARLDARLPAEGRTPLRARWRWALPTGGALAVAAAVALWLGRGGESPRALVAPADATLTAMVGPYARVAVVGPARVEVGAEGETSAVRVRSGTMLAEFTGGAGRSLHVAAPGVDVEVVGTLFAVAVDGSTTCVSVAHGRVRVTTAAGVVMVGGDERTCTGDARSHAIEPATRDALLRHEQLIAAADHRDRPAPSINPPAAQRLDSPPPSVTPAAAVTPPSPAAATPSVAAHAPPPDAIAIAAPSPTAITHAPSPTAITHAPSPAQPTTATPAPATIVHAPSPEPRVITHAPSPAATTHAPSPVAIVHEPAESPVIEHAPSPAMITHAPPAPAVTSPPAPPPAPAIVSHPAVPRPAEAPPAPITADSLYRDAEAALAKGDLAAADRALAKIIDGFSSSTVFDQALYERARLAYQRHAWSQARRDLDQLAGVHGSALAEPGQYLGCRVALAAHDAEVARCFAAYRTAFPRSPHALDVLALLVELAHADGGCRAAAPLIGELVRDHRDAAQTRAWRTRCPVPR